jgi:hypothetical protein
METETETKKVAKPQIVVNVSEEQKATLQQLKADYNLTDKGVIALLLEVAQNNRVGLMPDDNGEAQEVDTFAIVVAGLGLAKKVKVEKPVLTEEEKAALKAERKKERIRKKLAELTGQLEEVESEDEPETLVVVGE